MASTIIKLPSQSEPLEIDFDTRKHDQYNSVSEPNFPTSLKLIIMKLLKFYIHKLEEF